MPDGMRSLLVGVEPADMHNRDPREFPLVADGAVSLVNGILAHAEIPTLSFASSSPGNSTRKNRLTSSGLNAEPRAS
jgi:hypothetical protein